VTIIREGRTVESGALDELRHLTHLAIDAELVAPVPLGLLDGEQGIHDLQVDGRRVTCRVEPDQLDPLLRRLTEVGVRNLLSREPTLEELFLRFYDGSSLAPGDGRDP
jgi:ABC-2 type transport system ATP-binding protein